MGARRDGGTGQIKGRFPDDFSATTARLVCPDVTLADALIQLTLRGAPRPAGTSETGCGAASLPRRRQAARSGRLDCAAARSSSSPVSRSTPVDMSRSTLGAEAGKVMAVVQTAMAAAMPYTGLRDAIIAHPTMAEGLGALFSNVPADKARAGHWYARNLSGTPTPNGAAGYAVRVSRLVRNGSWAEDSAAAGHGSFTPSCGRTCAPLAPQPSAMPVPSGGIRDGLLAVVRTYRSHLRDQVSAAKEAV